MKLKKEEEKKKKRRKKKKEKKKGWKGCSVLCLEGSTHQEDPSGSVGSTSNHENKSKFFKNKTFRQYWTWNYLTGSNPNTSWFWKKCKWCSRLYSASSKRLFHQEDQKLDLQRHPPWTVFTIWHNSIKMYELRKVLLEATLVELKADLINW